MLAFPKIFACGTKQTQDLLKGEVEITEKIDGSQIGFGKINGELFIRSKGKQIIVDFPEKMFEKGVEVIKKLEALLPENYMFYGEYLQKPKHNVLCYESVPVNHIVLYGCLNDKNEYLNIDQIKPYALQLGLNVVPVLYKGEVGSIEELKQNIELESYLKGCKIEGFVIKNYNQSLLIGGQVINLLMGKYVSDAFKEVHIKDWKKYNTGKGKFEIFKASFCTEARWIKAVQHLKEKGFLTNSLKDIGNLLKEINLDIIEEEKESIKEFLWAELGKEILREAVKGFPEWYKKKLLNNMEV